MTSRKPPASQPPFGKRINELIKTDRKLGAKLLFEAVYSVPKTKITDEQLSFLSQANPSWEYIGNTQIAIRTHVFSPSVATSTPARTVLLSPSHGQLGISMQKFIPPLLAAGLQVLIVDHVGHGESAGSIWQLEIAIDTMASLMRKYAPLQGVIGHSVGGTVTAVALTRYPDIQCPRLMCFAPPLQAMLVTLFTLDKLGVDRSMTEDITTYGAETGWKLLDNIKTDYFESGAQNSRTKVLMVHDENDLVSSFEDTTWLASKFAMCEIVRTKGLKHYGCLNSEVVVGMATKFMVDGVESTGPERPLKL